MRENLTAYRISTGNPFSAPYRQPMEILGQYRSPYSLIENYAITEQGMDGTSNFNQDVL